MNQSLLNFLDKCQLLFQKKRKLQVDILFQSLTILILSIFSIIGYTYYNNTKVIIKQSGEYLTHFSHFLEDQVVQALEETENMVQLYTPLLSTLDLNTPLQDPEFLNLANSMSKTLGAHPYLTTLYFATPEGYFLELSSPKVLLNYLLSLGSKIPENTTSVLKIIQNPKNPEEHLDDALVQESNEQWVYLIDEKQFTKPRTGEKTGYDHRKRDWYIGAANGKHIQWSGVYTFASTLRGEKGITASKAIYDAKGTFRGVFSADITLKSFSHFLASRKISKNSFAYVIDQKDRTVANSNPDKINKSAEDNVTPQIKEQEEKLKELSEDLLAEALRIYEAEKGNLIRFSFGGIDYIARFDEFQKFFQHEWKTVVIAPLDDFVGQIRENRNQTFLYSLLILSIAFTLAYRLAKNISQPITTLLNEAKKIQNLDFSTKTMITSRIKEISDLSNAISSLKHTVQSFSLYIPKSLVKNLLHRKQQIHVGGSLKEVTLFFSDIESFTSISESIPPDKLFIYLSNYFEELTNLIIQAGGTIDKYIGDSIMAFWGAPLPDKNPVYNACSAALRCQRRLHDLNRLWKRDNHPIFNTRIGLHVGQVIIGNVGSSERMNYTAIGDSVNLCSRLEGINKYYGTHITLSEAVYTKIKDHFLCRPLDRVDVKGKTQSIKIFELVGQLQGNDDLYPTEEQITFCKAFEAAYNIFLTRQWEKASDLFKALALLHPQDMSVQLYLKRCEAFAANPPPSEWDGTFTMAQK
ncbi:MAG: adenylate/guanylate cyclase domain-containing protein [Alphaproteobacteria bacterium]